MAGRTLYEENISLLRADTASNLQKAVTEPNSKAEVLLSRTGKPIPCFKAKLIHSSYDPLKEAEVFAQGQSVEKGKVIILFGFGFGYHAESLRKAFPYNRLICFDFFPALIAQACEQRDFTALFSDPLFELFSDASLSGFLASFQRLHETAEANNCHAIVYPPLMKCADKEFQKVLQALERMEMGRKLPRVFGGVENENFLHNRSLLAEGNCSSLANLKACFKGVPALIVGAGPSLDAVLPLLYPYRKRCLILAVDAALSPLRANGIEPHLLVSIDPQESVLRHLSKHGELCIPSVVVPTSSQKVIETVKGRKIFMIQEKHTLIQSYPLLAKLGTTKAGNSVSCFALDAGLQFGCSPLFLAGLDNGFPQQRAYAKHTALAKAGDEFMKAHRIVEVPDLFGAPLSTHQNLYDYLRTTEAIITTTSTPFFQIGPLGAHIEGALPLSSFEVGSVLESLPKQEIRLEKIQETIEKHLLSPALAKHFQTAFA